MAKRIRVNFIDDGVTAVFELLWNDAPETCQKIWDALPIDSRAVHAIYSGSEVVCFLDSSIRPREENLTTRMLPGDVAYTFIPGGKQVGVPEDIAEIAFFYDRDASPRQPDGPWPMTLFGRTVEGMDELASACRDTRWSGAKRVRFERAGD